MKVLVLAGGQSAERDVSLASGAAVGAALVEAGCEVLVYDPTHHEQAIPWSPEALGTKIGTGPPEKDGALASVAGVALTPEELSAAGLPEVDVVFIALHGGSGENGQLQALLDAAGSCYAGSGMLASALAMNKHAAKRIFVAEGIPTPNWQVLERGGDHNFAEIEDLLGLPIIIKPNEQGSTVGLTLVKAEAEWQGALAEAFRWDRLVLAEEYIPGRELAVSILGTAALAVIEIVPSHAIYDYECKYTAGRTEYICPAGLDEGLTKQAQEQGLLAFRSLGCRGYGRVDFRLAADNRLYCLEVNTLPGMTANSLLPQAAQAEGVGFPELVRRICAIGAQSGRESVTEHPAEVST